MIYCVGMASMLIAFYFGLTFCPFESEVVNTICFITLPILFMIVLAVASSFEEKLTDRIKALEDKLNNKENAE